VVNTGTVMLDAATLANDLSEALRLRAEGGVAGRLLEMEAQLQEAQAAAAADAAARSGDAHAQEAQAVEMSRLQAAAEEAEEHHARMLDDAARAAQMSQDELREELQAARNDAHATRTDATAAQAAAARERRELEEQLAQQTARGEEAARARAEIEAQAAAQAAAGCEAELRAEIKALKAKLAETQERAVRKQRMQHECMHVREPRARAP